MSPGPVILKFGGTSVGDAEAIGRLVRHVSAAHQRAGAVVVVSALSGITDRLLQLAAAASAGDQRAIDSGVAEVRERHDAVVRAVVPEPSTLIDIIATQVAELRNLLLAVATRSEERRVG